MPKTEVIYADGSRSEFREGVGASHDGDMAILRIRIITAMSALRIYIDSGGRMQLTRNGAQLAIQNVAEPVTGKTYKRSIKGKEEAYSDLQDILWSIEDTAVVYEEES